MSSTDIIAARVNVAWPGDQQALVETAEGPRGLLVAMGQHLATAQGTARS